MSDNKEIPAPPDCKGCSWPGSCPCFDIKRTEPEVLIPTESLRILLHWAVRAGAEDGLYSVRKAVTTARKALEQ